MTQELGQRRNEPSLEVVLVTYQSRDLVGGDVRAAAGRRAGGRRRQRQGGRRRPGAGRRHGQNTRYVEGAGEGFAKAANAGARTSTADVVLFLNPDTAPPSEQLTTLVDDLAADPALAAVAATTVRPTGGSSSASVAGSRPCDARSSTPPACTRASPRPGSTRGPSRTARSGSTG